MLKQKTVYFREEDVELWEKVDNKAEFLHTVLNDSVRATTRTDTETIIKQAPIKKLVEESNIGVNLCKIHSIPLTFNGKCLQKGCKYA